MTTFPPEPPQSGDDEQPSAPPPPPPPGASSAPSEPGAPPPSMGYGAPMATSAASPAAGAYGAGPVGGYADWSKRALAGLIDYFGPSILANVVYYGVNRGLGSLLLLASLGWGFYNAYLGGQTGQSYGKKIAGIRLLSETTGAPIGGGMGIARYLVHIIDALPCYLGFLWPIWDSKRQTFADKVLKTVVVTT